jgi:hypothetical protein
VKREAAQREVQRGSNRREMRTWDGVLPCVTTDLEGGGGRRGKSASVLKPTITASTSNPFLSSPQHIAKLVGRLEMTPQYIVNHASVRKRCNHANSDACKDNGAERVTNASLVFPLFFISCFVSLSLCLLILKLMSNERKLVRTSSGNILLLPNQYSRAALRRRNPPPTSLP